MIPKMIGRGLISVLLALLAPIAASAEDAPTTKLHTIVTSSSQSVLFDVGINDKPSQTLEWSEATGTLTAKVTYSELSGHEAVETAPSDCRTLFFPFPTVKLDAQNNLVIGRTFQKALVLGHLEEGPHGIRVVLMNNVHLLVHDQNDTMSVSLVSISTTS